MPGYPSYKPPDERLCKRRCVRGRLFRREYDSTRKTRRGWLRFEQRLSTGTLRTTTMASSNSVDFYALFRMAKHRQKSGYTAMQRSVSRSVNHERALFPNFR